ncbi:hypothetical protein M409DRAFT_30384 [Zasmidium cellare ATCC 36951]|uniref:Xylanolytic transcriptional activator regulatory domain-containing protein n=1 Tax=Zasmidium cellare ATCC 36951 TaxID=1080233 RepID=A0A6A6BWZ4_ZASCE|nr:uncharacterized protein M409DRAFT_30384 [Zasmidium cellare ATCC 36951]KAF2159103.1 hypothetical protein M409DRAFT_30384 [Zasmidium cellare ATCC 36951]
MRGKHRRVTAHTRPAASDGQLRPEVEAVTQDEEVPAGSGIDRINPGSGTSVVAFEDEDEIFLGESNALRYVQNASNPSSGRHGRHRVDAEPSHQWSCGPVNCEAALKFPSRHLQEALLTAYFRWFHYSFPIVDEPDIWKRWQTNAIPALLLQSLLFIGATHCEDSVLEKLGHKSRQEAKHAFFSRVKTLYDNDFESSKLVIGQSLFLMSFWRGDPLAEKDSRHWIGAAIALLQKMGFHRTGHAQGVRKRLWWAVYIRERQNAATLGLPNRIRDEDCDVESLRREDFALAFMPTFAAENVDVVINFNMGMARMATLLGEVLQTCYPPSRTVDASEHPDLHAKLLRWRADHLGTMPISVADGAACRNFYVNMLLMAYHNLRILMFQSDRPELRNEQNGGMCSSHVVDASTAICRIVEDMLSSKDIGHCQIHVITNIFNTLCIQTLGLRTWTGERRTLAVYRAKICLLGLRELQKTWDVTNWVLRLYFRYLDDGTAARLAMEGAEEDLPPSTRQSQEQHHHEQSVQQPEPLLSSATQQYDNGQAMEFMPNMPFPMPNGPDASLLAELGDGFVFNGNGILEDHVWHPDLFAGVGVV